MYEFEYHNIIDFWTKEFGIYMSMDERTELITLYEQALIRYNQDLEFDTLCKSLCTKRYLLNKYDKLGFYVWNAIFTKAGMN
jgi:hypothetical protein